MRWHDPFPDLIRPIMGLEGGYSYDPADRGGATAYGVTEVAARAAGYTGDMTIMTVEEATAIYRTNYWVGPQFDTLYPLFPALAELLLNIGINMGPTVPARFLQRTLNVLNAGSIFSDLGVDGICGAHTREALRTYGRVRGNEGLAVLLGAVRSLVVARYVELVEANHTNRKFTYGWLRRGLAMA